MRKTLDSLNNINILLINRLANSWYIRTGNIPAKVVSVDCLHVIVLSIGFYTNISLNRLNIFSEILKNCLNVPAKFSKYPETSSNI